MSKTINELRHKHMIVDDATRLYVDCYERHADDEHSAWNAYADAAVSSEVNAGYTVLHFADGSRFDNAQQGIDRFYPAGA